jgi:L,D-transpeptidase-like protein
MRTSRLFHAAALLLARAPAAASLLATAPAAALLPSMAPAAVRVAAPSANPSGMMRLSDERTVTRWAYPSNHALIRSRPTGSARRVGRLRWLTEDRLPEIYLVLAEWREPHGSLWAKIRVPKRPNGTTGWVPRAALRDYTVVRELLDVDRSALRATVYRDGLEIWSARIGIGSGANPTPTGRFYVREKFRVNGLPVYGPYALGTSAFAPKLTEWPGGGVVGLHGTNQPGLVPGRPSHGCIRLRNRDIARLYRLAPRGTPIHIHD